VLTNRALAASLSALVLLGGCGSEKRTSLPSPPPIPSSTTTTSASTPGTRTVEALTAALLSPADVPGSTPSPASASSADISACFPGNPIAVKPNPTEVNAPELSLTDASGVERQFKSSARQATPEQAAAFVRTFASPTGSACALEAFKSAITNSPDPPKVDASGLTGAVTTATVADGGALLALSGNLSSETSTVPAEIDLLVFQKGGIVVSISAAALNGSRVPGQALELARKVAGRLS